MRAAVIEKYGEPPVVKDVDEPRASAGGRVVEVIGAPVNPVDISLASGRFYSGSPPTPYVPGGEGIGRVVDGGKSSGRVYFRAALPNGAMAERAITSGRVVAIPQGLEDGVAAALGTPGLAAYLGLTRRAQLKKGETVLVLGASGVLGLIAVQAAKLLHAGRVIAAGRNDEGLQRAQQLGADAIVDLKQTDGLTERIREASGGQLQVVIDPVWGAPAAAAVDAMSPHGRLIQIGQSAGAEASLKSSSVRGRYLSILGYTTFLVPWDEQAVAYRKLAVWAAAGKIKVEYEMLPLDAAADAWARQKASPHRKLVLSPKN